MPVFGVTDDTAPQFTQHDGAVTATTAGRRPGKRLAKGDMPMDAQNRSLGR